MLHRLKLLIFKITAKSELLKCISLSIFDIRDSKEIRFERNGISEFGPIRVFFGKLIQVC